VFKSVGVPLITVPDTNINNESLIDIRDNQEQQTNEEKTTRYVIISIVYKTLENNKNTENIQILISIDDPFSQTLPIRIHPYQQVLQKHEEPGEPGEC
jgi:hypothetical protein